MKPRGRSSPLQSVSLKSALDENARAVRTYTRAHHLSHKNAHTGTVRKPIMETRGKKRAPTHYSRTQFGATMRKRKPPGNENEVSPGLYPFHFVTRIVPFFFCPSFMPVSSHLILSSGIVQVNPFFFRSSGAYSPAVSERRNNKGHAPNTA